VVIRLTEGELNSWKRLVSCAASMFQRWSGSVSSLAATKSLEPKITVQLYAELNRIGVNLNQLTKQVNAGKLAVGLLHVLNALSAQQQTIIKHLLDDRG